MKLVKTVRQKYLTVKRRPRRRYHLIDGPFGGRTVFMSPSGKNTLVFSFKDYTGRYVPSNMTNLYNTNLLWEDHSEN